MPVLAVDTSADWCAAALWRADAHGGETLAARAERAAHGHAELLAPMVKAVLDEAKVSARDCERFCAVTGPGSFTGVRTGVSFVRALALASGRPALGVDAFSAWAAGSEGSAEGPVIVALDSRRGTAYVREMPGGEAVEESPDALAVRISRTPGARLTGNIAPAGFYSDGFDALDVSAVAALAAAADSADPAFAPKPFYLRPPDAKISARGA